MAQCSHPSGRFVLLGDACHAALPYLWILRGIVAAVHALLMLTHSPPVPKAQLRQSKMALSSAHFSPASLTRRSSLTCCVSMERCASRAPLAYSKVPPH